MMELKGVYVRLLDGSEDVYENVSLGKDKGYAVLHDYGISPKGFLVVSRLSRPEDDSHALLPIRVAVYAPRNWVSVRGGRQWVLMEDHPEQGPMLEL